MTIEEAIKKAIEGGWNPGDIEVWKEYHKAFNELLPEVVEREVDDFKFWQKHDGLRNVFLNHIAFLDPTFWQCLGKIMEWDKGKVYTFTAPAREQTTVRRGKLLTFQVPEHIITRRAKPRTDQWKREWHKFIDYLVRGFDLVDYFKDLTP